MTTKLTTCLWFDGVAEDAARLYTSVFPRSRILSVVRYGAGAPGPEGSVMTVTFELDGREFTALNGGPVYTISPAVSFVIHCRTQAEVDHYWERLTEGGREVQCGWLTDRFGVSWQVVPVFLLEVLAGDDAAKAARVTAAMRKMIRLDLAALEAAAAA